MSDDGAILREEKRDEHGRFIVPPKSPGRPKGARSKLSEAFFEALQADFAEHGVAAIVKMRDERPQDYVKAIASLQTKELSGPDGEAIPITEIRRVIVDPED